MGFMGCLWLFTIALIIVLTVVTVNWRHRRSEELIDGWARANDLNVIEIDDGDFLGRPMFWSTKGQSVYRIVVSDQQGRQRSGWIRCGSHWAGLHSNEVAVRWDKA